VLGPLAFVKEQIIDLHPILLPVWVAGWCGFSGSGAGACWG